MKTKLKILFHILIFSCITYACDSKVYYQDFKSTPSPWPIHETIDFEFEILDTISSNSFYLCIRNNEEYTYSNIYFFIKTTFPDQTISRDTVECILANARGKWVGNGIGSLKESEHLIQKSLIFPQSGDYKMEIEQAMRVDTLYGIKDIGIKIVKNTLNK